MSSPSQVAAGFTITGLLDGASRTRGRYPVSEIAVADIADHPTNAAYSMDPAGIAELAESIRKDGLTDLPLVRKVGDGSWQMVSGHRRKAAYALLAKDDPAYERMPCSALWGGRRSRACPTNWRGCSRKRRKRAPTRAPARSRKIGVTSMKRLGRFLMAALKVTLGFFVWLFRAVFKWVM